MATPRERAMHAFDPATKTSAEARLIYEARMAGLSDSKLDSWAALVDSYPEYSARDLMEALGGDEDLQLPTQLTVTTADWRRKNDVRRLTKDVHAGLLRICVQADICIADIAMACRILPRSPHRAEIIKFYVKARAHYGPKFNIQSLSHMDFPPCDLDFATLKPDMVFGTLVSLCKDTKCPLCNINQTCACCHTKPQHRLSFTCCGSVHFCDECRLSLFCSHFCTRKLPAREGGGSYSVLDLRGGKCRINSYDVDFTGPRVVSSWTAIHDLPFLRLLSFNGIPIALSYEYERYWPVQTVELTFTLEADLQRGSKRRGFFFVDAAGEAHSFERDNAHRWRHNGHTVKCFYVGRRMFHENKTAPRADGRVLAVLTRGDLLRGFYVL